MHGSVEEDRVSWVAYPWKLRLRANEPYSSRMVKRCRGNIPVTKYAWAGVLVGFGV